MTLLPAVSNDPRTVQLSESVRASRRAVDELCDAMRLVNDPNLHDAVTSIADVATSVLAQHERCATPTIADDAANLRTLFSQIPIPREDVDLGPLPGLTALRSARGVLYQELDDVLRAARNLGWKPLNPDLPYVAYPETVKNRDVDLLLRSLILRMESVERLLDSALKPEGIPAPDRSATQVVLVQSFVESLKNELALAKLEASLKTMLNFTSLGRVVENIAELTTNFVITVRGLSAKMSVALREASEVLPRRVRRLIRGFKTIIQRTTRSLKERRPSYGVSSERSIGPLAPSSAAKNDNLPKSGMPGFDGLTDLPPEMLKHFSESPTDRGRDLRVNYEITLAEAFHGKEATIAFPMEIACGVCGGSGRVPKQKQFSCSGCAGSGRVKQERRLVVMIPQGIDDDTRMRLSGEGEAGKHGAMAGDLYIFLSIAPHEFFQRKGADLYCRVPVSRKQALLGTEILVPSFESYLLKVKIPAGTQSMKQFRIKGRGMPVLRSRAVGDLYIQVVFETESSVEEQETLERLRSSSVTSRKARASAIGLASTVQKNH